MKEVDVQLMEEWSDIYIGIKNCTENVLQHNIYLYDSICLKINTAGLPLFKSTALDL